MIQAHILRKSKRWIKQIQKMYFDDLVFADKPWKYDEHLFRIIHMCEGSGNTATEYAVINRRTRVIISKHRMYMHAERKCASLMYDRDRLHYARRRIAMLPPGGRLRDY